MARFFFFWKLDTAEVQRHSSCCGLMEINVLPEGRDGTASVCTCRVLGKPVKGSGLQALVFDCRNTGTEFNI